MDGTVPSNKKLVDGTVPSIKELMDGTVPSNSTILFNELDCIFRFVCELSNFDLRNEYGCLKPLNIC